MRKCGVGCQINSAGLYKTVRYGSGWFLDVRDLNYIWTGTTRSRGRRPGVRVRSAEVCPTVSSFSMIAFFRSFVHSILIIGSSCFIFILLACIIANIRYRDEIDYSRRSSEDITRSSKRFLPHQRVKFFNFINYDDH